MAFIIILLFLKIFLYLFLKTILNPFFSNLITEIKLIWISGINNTFFSITFVFESLNIKGIFFILEAFIFVILP